MINDIVLSLFTWTAAQMGIPADFSQLSIQTVDSRQAAELEISQDAAAVFVLDGPHVGKIFLTDHVDLTTPKGQSFVVHEMVHHFQYRSGFFKTTNCAASSEPLAYSIQNRYLAMHNQPAHSSESFVKFISVCWRVTDK